MHGSVVLGQTYGFFLIDERYYEQLNVRGAPLASKARMMENFYDNLHETWVFRTQVLAPPCLKTLLICIKSGSFAGITRL